MTKGILTQRTSVASAQMNGVLAENGGNPIHAGAWTADEEQVEAIKQQILKKLRVRMMEWHSTQRTSPR